jgi:peptidoglycan/xylan/chitin deacetylase (PgdA/CDA1 family)
MSNRPPTLTRRAALAGVALAGGFGGLTGASAPAAARCRLAGRTLALATTGGFFVGLQSHPRTLALAEREVVLTFDDGPLPGPTTRVLDALAAYGAPATFFLIGRNAAANPALVRRMAAEGHTLAHHTLSHPWTLRQRSFSTGVSEIEVGVAAVEAAAGQSTPRFFRYPGFADTPELNAWLARQGYGVFGSDLWSSDWTPMSPERQLTLTLQRLNRTRRGVILMHDVVEQTARMLPAFLQALCDQGYRVVSLTAGATPPALSEAQPGWRSATERIIAGRR